MFQVMRSFLMDSEFCNMAPLFVGSTVLIVSKQGKVKEMLSTLRGSPQMVLLGRYLRLAGMRKRKSIVTFGWHNLDEDPYHQPDFSSRATKCPNKPFGQTLYFYLGFSINGFCATFIQI